MSQVSHDEGGADVSSAEKPYTAEYALSARAACKKCKGKIAKDALRIGKVLKSTKFDGNMTLWFHTKCLLAKPGVFKSLGDVAGVDLLRWEDQQALRRYLQEGPAALSASSAAARGPPHDAGASPSPTVGARAAGAPARGPKGKASKQVQGQEEEMAQTGPGAEAAGDFSVEYASSNRSSCRGCGEKIAKGEVRMAKSSVGERGFPVPLWHHVPCFLASSLWGRPLPELPGWSSLRAEDRQALLQGKPLVVQLEEAAAKGGRKGKGKGRGKGAKDEGEAPHVEEDAKGQKAGKGAQDKAEALRAEEGEPSGEAKGKGKGKGAKKESEKVHAEGGGLKEEPTGKGKGRGKGATAAGGAQVQAQGGGAGEAQEERGAKARGRKREGTAGGEGPEAEQRGAKKGRAQHDAQSEREQGVEAQSEREQAMEAQSRLLWAVKDQLRACCSLADLRAVLSANGYDSQGPEMSLRDRIADAVLFGPLPLCPLCSSRLECRDGAYRCRGFLSAWSQCHYKTRQDLKRGHRSTFKLPEEASQGVTDFAHWLKARGMLDKNATPPTRILPPEQEVTPQPSPVKTAKPAPADGAAGRGLAERRERVQKEEKGIPAQGRDAGPQPLKGLHFVLLGKLSQSQAAWKTSIAEVGGRVLPEISAEVDCVVSSETSAERHLPKIQLARSLGIPIVSEAYLKDCTSSTRRMRMADYALAASTAEALGEGKEAEGSQGSQGRRRVKVKGRAAVHEDSGLQESCHVLDEDGTVYSTTLNRAEVALGINSFYILQVLEDDKLKQWYLYRKWGRVGNAQIGDHMVQRMDKESAISEFYRLFYEKTGNSWNLRSVPGEFKKRAGKFFPLEIDYGVGEGGEEGLMQKLTGARSKLHPQLVQLLLMLFDVAAYQAAMLEFEINVAEMPLGKLTKRHVAQGFQVLTEIQNALQMATDGTGRREGALVDASNRFFTLIPSVHPRVIRTLDDLQAQVRMLESLSEMEIASSLLSSSPQHSLSQAEDPLDEYYRRLQCNLEPLPESSPDFELVKHYLANTHAPTHREWGLELVDVFRVQRGPEQVAFMGDLDNQMLLWHGSRTSNFVGILSQGLRIAPPEAPVTGYMFGKGVYFADLVSKSAQYCFAQPDSPVGLMLLSRVALGAMYELRKAQFIESLPSGKHSTKGLGKVKPEESEARTWQGNVAVPCGKPVASGVRATELNYNEYIVYDTSQVRLEFLLRVRFVYKR